VTEKRSTTRTSTPVTILRATCKCSPAPLIVKNSLNTKAVRKARLTPEILSSFSDLFLKKNFDEAVKTPQAHIEWWALACLERRYVAIAAPRGHAKSTAISHTYVLANVCFRIRRHVLIVSDTETQATQFLGNIKRELLENVELRTAFGFKKFRKESETELVIEWEQGPLTRIIARGASQRIRGTNWLGIRPDLVVGDDLENDEAVLNEERREKFQEWFYNTLLPLGSKSCIYRVVGTILHEDSLLAGFMPNTIEDDECIIEPLRIRTTKPGAWVGVLYRAHPDFDDFTSLLWPEQHSEDHLREIQQAYVERGYPEGYSQEYLNNPIASTMAYFREQDLLRMPEEELHAHSRQPEHFYIACDFAISDKSKRAYTAMVVGGVAADGVLRIREVIRERLDGLDIVDYLFALHSKYKRLAAQQEEPIFLIEKENIAKSLGPFLDTRMRETNTYLAIEEMAPIQDKVLRARPFQARQRAGMVEYDMTAPWWPALKHELLTFPGTYADQVDALAWLGHYLARMTEAPSQLEVDEWAWEREQEYTEDGYRHDDDQTYDDHRDSFTGY
jgi:predicted phage terminase large subunit-like protein